MASSKKIPTLKMLARIQDSVVVEIIQEIDNIDQEWSSEFLSACIDVTGHEPPVTIGMTYQNNVFAAFVSVPLTRIQQMSAALNSGCQIVSSSLTATYNAIGPAWVTMKDETQYVVIYGSFSGGLTELDWSAKSGPVIFTTPDELKIVTRAIADWITNWQRYVDNKVDTQPSQPITVA